ncbi:MAG TPA: FAD binding domain-containing protein, partial [Tepidisphaeraceae bacterium]|nr:FAD binding domain-containing protein [Tepidisphaeraceae bacterium]
MRDYVVLYINGRRTEVRGKHVFASLSDFLRYELGQTGTKVVCAEGDCGSCSVLLGRVIDNHPEYSPVCSCIQYLYQLDAAHVVTIEGLTCNHDPNRSMGVSPMSSGQGMDETSTLREAAALNPVQRAMVQCQGAQCGYCTPGFVVAMHDLFDDGQPKEEPAIRRALTGNLCRCTGYEPILQAASQVDASKIRRISDLYPTQEIAAELTELSKDDVRVADGDRIFFKPTHARDAAKFRGEHPNCTIITGGTDIGVQVNKGIRQISAVLDTHGLHALRKIQGTGDHLLVGAGATLSELEESCKPHFPELARLLEYFGSPLIRNAGTLAGNLANGSPIGDTLPPLFVMNAEIELTNPTASRWVNINSFYT